MPGSTVDLYRLEFSTESLPEAVRQIFMVNDYDVIGPVQQNGAEIDLVAKLKRDVFPEPIYIEVTTEYVDVAKYGKDCTKFILLQQKNPRCRCLIVSSAGFTVSVRERAKESSIETLTYTELLQKFEKFDPYLRELFIDGPNAKELDVLRESYEPPVLDDAVGRDAALAYLDKWRLDKDASARWLIIVGEYGTGKTALTRVLQYDWCLAYAANPLDPIVFRMELRNFLRQFDANGLLHQFLDSNGLGHLSLAYIYSLIRSGRLILLLDGYDEMAQYMNTRERRACLEALATLSDQGARGILTSRPNYFSEAEELTVLEALYKELSGYSIVPLPEAETIAQQERRVDQLLGSHFVNRFERTLKDLTPEQTESLVKRKLAKNEAGQKAVLNILRSTFRDQGAANLALSGKPVIITYLLDVVDSLLSDPATAEENLTEWSVYQLILEKLMLRDYARTSEILPRDRREFLRRLSVTLSKREKPTIDENEFKEMVARETSLRPSISEEERRQTIDSRFEDLRASTTLTRSGSGRDLGWRFSHNSLRECLLTEFCLNALMIGGPIADRGLPISVPMRNFAAAQPDADLAKQMSQLARRWNEDANSRSVWLSLLWGHISRPDAAAPSTFLASNIATLSGGRRLGEGTSLSRLVFSSGGNPQDLQNFEFSGTEMLDVDFTGANLQSSKFVGAWLDGCNFSDCDLTACNFTNSVLNDVHFSGASLKAVVFINIDEASSIFVASNGSQIERLSGEAMLGFLKFSGAHTGTVNEYWVLRNHPRFSIIEKICRKLTEQATRQLRGLVQRGVASTDTGFANDFAQRLITQGYVENVKGRNGLIAITTKGRDELTRFVDGTGYMPSVVSEVLRES